MLLIVLTAGALLGLTAGQKGVHQGCWKDYHDPRDMPHGYWGDVYGMTIPKCIDHCAALGFSYAGLQEGFECWCGNNYGRYNKAHDCDLFCIGDIQTTCGGHYANSIYTAKDVPGATPCTPVDCKLTSWTGWNACSGECGINNGQKIRTREITQPAWCGGKLCGNVRDSDTCTRPEPCKPSHPYMYMGCWKDDSSDRALPDDEIEGHELTIDICVEHCKERGHAFAGVQNGLECWCGTPPTGNYTKHGYSKYCNVPCGGNKDQFCGGGYTLSVFNTSTPWGCTPVDCEMDSWIDWQECFGECGEMKGREHRYRNITREQECGGTACPTFVDERPCNAERFYCPGENYLGCYKDAHDRDLPEGHYEDAQNTADKCIINCRKQGYKYAGVSGIECWCGNSYGKHGEAKECIIRCPGDRKVGCGGKWQNSVFNTTHLTQSEKDQTSTIGTPVDCQLSDWSAWRPCDLQCIRSRSRDVIKAPQHGGKACETTTLEALNCDRKDAHCRVIDQMYVGCYRDGEERDLEYGPIPDSYQNPGKCIYHCREKGYRYAGLQGGFECFCGNQYGRYDISYMCNAPCWGDQKSFCGGGWANNIYTTSEIVVPTTTGGPCVPEDCVPGPWGAWSECSGTDPGEGRGRRYRFRPVLVPEKCGGKPCVTGEEQTCTIKPSEGTKTPDERLSRFQQESLRYRQDQHTIYKRNVDDVYETNEKNAASAQPAVVAMVAMAAVVMVIAITLVIQARIKRTPSPEDA